MKFSEKHGYRPVRSVIQAETVDQPLKNGLWSEFHSLFYLHFPSDNLYAWMEILWKSHFKKRIDKMEEYPDPFLSDVHTHAFSDEWYEIYDFLQFVLETFPFMDSKEHKQFREDCNAILEAEMSAWRIIGDKIIRMTSEAEIESLEEAAGNKIDAVALHINKAIELMSDRTSPDYLNSIKEAISAVETMCRIASGNPKATLGDALKQMEKQGFPIHSAQKAAFEKLYGYTSDQGGIRHSAMDNPTTDFEDAKYMLVTCSAFVNFIKARTAVQP
jgi:hypothetical protein